MYTETRMTRGSLVAPRRAALPVRGPSFARRAARVEEVDLMSIEAIEKILERGARDPEFASQIRKDPKVLDEYELTPDERTAILSRDNDQIEALGMNERVTKSLFRGKTWD